MKKNTYIYSVTSNNLDVNSYFFNRDNALVHKNRLKIKHFDHSNTFKVKKIKMEDNLLRNRLNINEVVFLKSFIVNFLENDATANGSANGSYKLCEIIDEVSNETICHKYDYHNIANAVYSLVKDKIILRKKITQKLFIYTLCDKNVDTK